MICDESATTGRQMRMSFCTYVWQTGTVPRPATGKTPVRNLRVPEHIWGPALDKAKAEGRSLTEVITTYLRRYISTPPRRHAKD
jgi:hypothetical protein